jgi:hypothetical protein
MRFRPGLLSNFRYFVLLFSLCVVSCAGGDLTQRSTVDATLSAKCPPQEACAPEAGLEDAAQEYLEALILGNCDQAADYWLPERKDRAREHCASGRLLPDLRDDSCQLIEFSSRDSMVEKIGEGFSVHLSGEYLFECDQETESYVVEDLILFFEEQEGEWYIAGFQ